MARRWIVVNNRLVCARCLTPKPPQARFVDREQWRCQCRDRVTPPRTMDTMTTEELSR